MDSPAGRLALREGFSPLEGRGRYEFRWIVGHHATIVLPRSSTTAAEIQIIWRPVDAPDGRPQTATAMLNGIALGTVTMARDWQTVRFMAPSRAWWIGFNQLELFLSFTVSPHEVGTGDDPRTLAAAVHRIDIVRSGAGRDAQDKGVR